MDSPIKVECSHCATDVRETGFTVATTSYQAYMSSAGKLVKSYSRKSAAKTVHCALCGSQVLVPAEQLVAKAAA